jgi:hypothetical protein
MHTSGCRFHIAGRTRISRPQSLDGTWDLVSGRHGPMLDTRISRLVQGLSVVERSGYSHGHMLHSFLTAQLAISTLIKPYSTVDNHLLSPCVISLHRILPHRF